MKLPSWLTWYKKPEYRNIKEYSAAISSGRRSLSPDGRNKTAIPSRLKLERVLENKTCSPMSLYDFYMYLKYIEFSPENLEFYIWFRNYEANYAKLNSFSEKDDASFHSSSESSGLSLKQDVKGASTTEVNEHAKDPEIAADTVAHIVQLISSDALCTAKACSPSVASRVKSFVQSANSPAAPAPPTPTELANAASGHRSELNAVVKMYLVEGAEKELNIPPGLRQQALQALQASSDPAHLIPVADHVYSLLRNCSHRNFVRLGVSNGTIETICVATGLGIVLTIAGFLCSLLLAFTPTMGSHSRWTVFGAWPMWWLGVSLILSGLRGSCFFLLLFSRRQPLPWERFDDSASMLSQRSGIMKILSRLMIFDRKVKVKDAHLRKLQFKIVVQSLVGGSVFASVGVLLFIFLPVWTETRPQ